MLRHFKTRALNRRVPLKKRGKRFMKKHLSRAPEKYNNCGIYRGTNVPLNVATDNSKRSKEIRNWHVI